MDKTCNNCAYFNVSEDKRCVRCKNMYSPSDSKYEALECLWTDYIDSDVIEHPSHYTNGGMECIDEMVAIFGKTAVRHFCICNVWKYRYRAINKNGEEDLKKSDWYLKKYIELGGKPISI